jgi:hypothetical protein
MAGSERFEGARLRVIESWKRAHSPQATVQTATITDCCLCGITVKKGQRLLVYVYGPPPYKLSDCSRTQALDGAAKELAVLRAIAGGGSARGGGNAKQRHARDEGRRTRVMGGDGWRYVAGDQ